MTKEITCPDCGGKGLHYGDTTLTDEPCRKCEGSGVLTIDDGEPPDEQSSGNEKLTREELNRDI